MSKIFFGLALIAGTTLAMAVEEPAYAVIRKLDDVEIRQYAPYVVAELTVDAAADKAASQAFPVLAAYIFGNNKGGTKLAMTAPVIQASVPGPVELATPAASRSAADSHLVRFVLPKGVSPESAPVPIDQRIRLRDVAPVLVAVIVYSGTWSASNYQEHLDKLKVILADAGLAWKGEPVYARYNPPFTPWFMRRNEIWLTLASIEGPVQARIN
ncbi:MAG: heme-binding protein [Rhodocyclales bacterium]|nr:heme-binding protein [Rhodocyclales bacterium]